MGSMAYRCATRHIVLEIVSTPFLRTLYHLSKRKYNRGRNGISMEAMST